MSVKYEKHGVSSPKLKTHDPTFSNKRTKFVNRCVLTKIFVNTFIPRYDLFGRIKKLGTVYDKKFSKLNLNFEKR